MSDAPASIFATKEVLAFERALYARHVIDANFKNRDELLGFYGRGFTPMSGPHSKAA